MKLNRLATAAVAASLVLLVGCAGEDAAENAAPDETTDAQSAETFPTTAVDPVTADSVTETVEDPGLNVEWTMYGASIAPLSGDAAIHVKLKNLNDIPIPPSVIETPTLSVSDGVGGRTEIDPVDDATSGLESGLDLPLGAGATTNLVYVFDTTTGQLWDAEFQIGNLVFEGNLNF